MKKVVILGASDKPERYSYRAFHLLGDHGHQIFPVHPKLEELQGTQVYANLSEIPFRPDVLTVYVNSEISSTMEKDIIDLNPKHVIFNPGSENPPLQSALANRGISCQEACTLVLLNTGQF